MTCCPHSVASADDEPATTGAVWSQLFLRTASSPGVLVVGGYFVYLRDHGVTVNSLILGGLSALVYVTELLFAPLAGSLSDRRGRRSFLLAGLLLSAVAVLLIPLGSTDIAVLPAAVIVGLVGMARLLEGLGAALSVPATLGFLAEITDELPALRGRSMGFFELAAALGIAAGAALGPLLWERFGLVAFVALAGLYLFAALLVLGVREEPRDRPSDVTFSFHRYAHILLYRPLVLFSRPGSRSTPYSASGSVPRSNSCWPAIYMWEGNNSSGVFMGGQGH